MATVGLRRRNRRDPPHSSLASDSLDHATITASASAARGSSQPRRSKRSLGSHGRLIGQLKKLVWISVPAPVPAEVLIMGRQRTDECHTDLYSLQNPVKFI